VIFKTEQRRTMPRLVSCSVKTADSSATSVLTASNLHFKCDVETVTCTKNFRKMAIQCRYRYAATAIWWTERNLIPLTVEAAGTPRERREGESRRESPRLQREGGSLPAAPPQAYSSRRCYAATHSNSSSLSRSQLHRSAPP
jgi:hypothetical protein